MAEEAVVLLLSEDSSERAYPTMQEVFRTLVVQGVARAQTQRIRYIPAREEAALRMLRGNTWKSTGQRYHSDKVRLVKMIASNLAIPNNFVAFHVDGDVPFARREQSENFAKFAREIVDKVRMLLCAELKITEANAEQFLNKLFILLPCYSIEAWLFQNTATAIGLLKKHHSWACVELFEQWRENRAELDEIVAPKDRVPIGNKHNEVLAKEQFPAADVYDVGKSFAVAANDIANCSRFVELVAPSSWAV